jgi:hypothetical protein
MLRFAAICLRLGKQSVRKALKSTEKVLWPWQRTSPSNGQRFCALSSSVCHFTSCLISPGHCPIQSHFEKGSIRLLLCLSQALPPNLSGAGEGNPPISHALSSFNHSIAPTHPRGIDLNNVRYTFDAFKNVQTQRQSVGCYSPGYQIQVPNNKVRVFRSTWAFSAFPVADDAQ